MEIFWKTIAYYNSATWIYQLLIIVAGLLLTVMLIKNPRPWVKMGMKLYMIFLYLWIAIAYYAICCDERSYNGALAMFWVVMATIWVWDAITGYTTFERTYKYDILSYVLLILPFVYPLVSIARGLTFPGITSPVMPCSVTVFTIGLLLLFSRKVNMFLVLFLCHWSLIGLSKTYFFNIPEDFLWPVQRSLPYISFSGSISSTTCMPIQSLKQSTLIGCLSLYAYLSESYLPPPCFWS